MLLRNGIDKKYIIKVRGTSNGVESASGKSDVPSGVII